MTRTRVFAALLALASCFWVVSASAQQTEEPMKAAAKDLYNEARDARKSDDFATCYAKSTAAWAIHKHPSIAALAGDCGVSIGSHRDAAEKLRFFFDSPAGVGSAELRAHLQARFDEAKKHIGTVEVSASVPDATCEVDGKRVGKLPVTLYVEPGSHAFEVRHGMHRTENRNVTVAAGATVEAVFELERLRDVEMPAPTTPAEPGLGYVVGATVSGVVAAGGLALMIASLVLHGSASDDIDRLDAEIDAAGGDASCNGGGGALSGQCSELSSAIDDQSSFATLFPVGAIIAGVGVAATATFVVLHFVGPDSTTTEASLHVTPTGVAVSGRF